ncbi:MAG: metallophosphoesterase [Marmoricola sp.]|nr:metallophosphoesterase [Marmoricola sp.]
MRVRHGLILAVAWLVIALPAWAFLFLHSSTSMVVASHDAVVTPTLDGHARVEMGPYLPDLRRPTGSRFGVRIRLEKTTATSTGELVRRYASIAGHPDGEVRRVTVEVEHLARDAALRAGLLALLPIGLWQLLGAERRAELLRPTIRRSIGVVLVGGLVVLALAEPWRGSPTRVQSDGWIPAQQALPEVTVPKELMDVQVQGGLLTASTQRLLQSAFSGYDDSKMLYAKVEASVPQIAGLLHLPDKGDTVAVLVSDRHDNIGMDGVVEAVSKAAGATVVLDAGDDTSTGEPWEAFSLDSLDQAFEKFDTRVAVSGNHDNGTFVNSYLEKLGWTHLDGKPVEPFAGVRMFGVDDPRASGLGNWRDEKGLTFAEVKQRVGDAVCDLDAKGKRVATLMVHDANLGGTALERGCTDLVIAGHLHVQVGPDRIVGENGNIGYTYTNGTTGGAAYAIAIGKPRREAEFTFITYRDGKPIGLQPIKVETTGAFEVSEYLPLTLR